MNGDITEPRPPRASSLEVTAVFILGYGAAALLIYTLLSWGGIWNWLAGTRTLRILMDTGIVALTDADHGFIQGIPDHDYFRGAMDPVGWGVLAAAIGLIFLQMALKAVQFHSIASLCGSRGSLGEHGRAYLYGDGLGRLLPLNFGSAATVSALVGQGLSPVRARFAVYISDLFSLFEIIFFAAVVVAFLGWVTWVNAMFWAILIAIAAFLIIRRAKPGAMSAKESLLVLKETLALLSTRPTRVLALCGLSIISFLLLDIAVYLIAAAYTSENVILHIEHEILLTALVAGYLAKFIQLTPGGMGQFEWGFAAALYFSGGVGQPEAMIMAMLFGGFRLATGAFAALAIGSVFGVETSVRRVMNIFRGERLEAQAASA